MPTYEFRCPRGHEFEKFYRTISRAESQAACPECGELAEHILSPTGFAFKGSGFYLTDYGRNAHREKGAHHKSNANDAASDDGGATVKPDAAPASTTDGAKSADSGSSSTRAAPSPAPTPAPAAESKPAPKKSTGE